LAVELSIILVVRKRGDLAPYREIPFLIPTPVRILRVLPWMIWASSLSTIARLGFYGNA
jgi:hypothetical protein